MDEPVLRHRRTEEDGEFMDTSLEGNNSAPRNRRRRRFLAWPRVFFVLVTLVCIVLFYQYELLAVPFLSPADSWRPLPTRRTVTSGADVEKRDAIVDAFKRSWSAYERDAMGSDEYHPISHTGSNFSSQGGIGYMVVDAIDTLYIMGLKDEYRRARRWIEAEHTFDRDSNFNTFETTIRVLGGLLSIFHLTQDRLFLLKATDLAERMLPVFDTPTGLPMSMANLGLRKAVDDPYQTGLVSTAEVATLQLEWRYLSHATGNPVYWDKVEKVMQVLKNSKSYSNLVPIYMNANTGLFLNSEIRLGSRGDSYYEYLLKQYLQTNGTESVYREMYDAAMQGIHDKLLVKGVKNGMTFTVELVPTHSRDPQKQYTLSRKQDHLVCFLGGSLMLGATTAGTRGASVSRPPQGKQLTNTGKRDWKTGYRLLETCINTHKTATGLSPEIVYFHTPEDAQQPGANLRADWYIKGARPHGPPVYDARYILRPETVESIFLAYRLTGDARYRKIGWRIFNSIDKYCRLEDGGYANILNVDDKNSRKDDKMETFWLSETLKYLYLLFSDESVIPLDKYVFNTEAHPLPIFTPNHPLAEF